MAPGRGRPGARGRTLATVELLNMLIAVVLVVALWKVTVRLLAHSLTHAHRHRLSHRHLYR